MTGCRGPRRSPASWAWRLTRPRAAALDRDLFADDEGEGLWFEDPKLLSDLAMQRLRVAADELASHWKWAEPVLDADWSTTARFGRVHPAPTMPTDAERAELDRLEARLDALTQQDTDCAGEAQEERRLAERIDAIEGRGRGAGAVLARGPCPCGLPRLHRRGGPGWPSSGVWCGPKTCRRLRRTGRGPHDTGGPSDEATQTPAARPDPRISAPARTPPPADPEAEARKAAGVGIGLADDLRAIRTAPRQGPSRLPLRGRLRPPALPSGPQRLRDGVRRRRPRHHRARNSGRAGGAGERPGVRQGERRHRPSGRGPRGPAARVAGPARGRGVRRAPCDGRLAQASSSSPRAWRAP